MNKIVAKNKKDLIELIKYELDNNGHLCDLNHIDVSNITDMSNLFLDSYFDGNISEWNVSNVTNMRAMFKNSYFCGDISKWDVSNVTDMTQACWSKKFYSDISNWKPYSLERFIPFCPNESVLPYWLIANKEERKKLIDSYHLNNHLEKTLELNQPINQKKPKI